MRVTSSQRALALLLCTGSACAGTTPRHAEEQPVFELSQRFRAKRCSLCIACPVALDFERTRILDWIAYHEMSGVDCFILVLDDKRMSEAASRRVLEQLRS